MCNHQLSIRFPSNRLFRPCSVCAAVLSTPMAVQYNSVDLCCWFQSVASSFECLLAQAIYRTPKHSSFNSAAFQWYSSHYSFYMYVMWPDIHHARHHDCRIVLPFHFGTVICSMSMLSVTYPAREPFTNKCFHCRNERREIERQGISSLVSTFETLGSLPVQHQHSQRASRVWS